MTQADPWPPDPPTGAVYTIPFTDDPHCVAKIRDHVFIGAPDTDLYSVRWCAIGDPTDWPTPGTDDARAKQAGSQKLSTKFGPVTAIAGNDFYGYIFQTDAITKATFVGGDVVYSFDTFEEGRGCVKVGRMAQIDDKVFFSSRKGFHILENDQIIDIGYGAVDDQ